MGNWSLTGIGLMVGLFFIICAFLFTQIDVDNPFSGHETNVWEYVIDWIVN